MALMEEIILQDMQCIYKHNIEAHLHNHYCHRKAISITYSECAFIDLINQSAMHMCLITLSSVACLAVPYFLHYLTNCMIFGRMLKCVF